MSNGYRNNSSLKIKANLASKIPICPPDYVRSMDLFYWIFMEKEASQFLKSFHRFYLLQQFMFICCIIYAHCCSSIYRHRCKRLLGEWFNALISIDDLSRIHLNSNIVFRIYKSISTSKSTLFNCQLINKC